MASLKALRQLRELERQQIAAIDCEVNAWQGRSLSELHQVLPDLLTTQERLRLRLRLERLQGYDERILSHRGLNDAATIEELSSSEVFSNQAVNCLAKLTSFVAMARSPAGEQSQRPSGRDPTPPWTPASATSAASSRSSADCHVPPVAPAVPTLVVAHPSSLDISPEVFDGL